jgi:hypothetical protein
MAGKPGERDQVDAIIEQWGRERPGMDVSAT